VCWMRRGSFLIDRAPADVSLEEFDARFYEPQQPVLIEGLGKDWPARDRWTPEYLQRGLMAAKATPSVWWFEISDDAFRDDYRVPDFVRRHLDSQPSRQVRRGIWLSGSGTITPWHYDASCPQICHVQVSGRKRFTLVSPRSPLPWVPFWFESHLDALPPEEALSNRHVDTTFELGPGDAVFIPLHWAHRVVSLGEVNVSFTWSWTDLEKFKASDTAVGVREKETLLALLLFRTVFDRFRSKTSIGREYYKKPYAAMVRILREFGGVPNFGVANGLRGTIPASRLLLRMLREMPHIVPAVGAYRRRRLRELAQFGGARTAHTFFLQNPSGTISADLQPPNP
jgi:hypothetical protein